MTRTEIPAGILTTNSAMKMNESFLGIPNGGGVMLNGSSSFLGVSSGSADVGNSAGLEEDDEEWIVFKSIKLIVAFVVTILIIVNNLISLVVLRDLKDIGKRMKILLYSLSISDICLGVTVCLPALPSGVLGYWPFSTAACQVSGAMSGVAIGVSLWSLTAISIERYVMIRKPLQRHLSQSMLYLVLGVCFIWVFSITFFTFPILQKRNFQYYVYDQDVIACSFRWESTAYFMVAKSVYPVLSGSIILFNNIQIHLALKRAKFDREKWKARKPSTSNDNPSNDHNSQRSGVANKPRSFPFNPTTKLDDNTNHQSPGFIEYNNIIRIGENSTITNNRGNNHAEQGEVIAVERSSTIEVKRRRIFGNARDDTKIIMTRSMIDKNLKARLLLVFASLLFFTTTGPYMLTSLFDHFIQDYEMPAGVKFASLWLLHTNSFVNFYIYSFIYTDFRQRYRSLLVKMFACDYNNKKNKINISNSLGGEGGGTRSRNRKRTTLQKSETGMKTSSSFNRNDNSFLHVDSNMDDGSSLRSHLSSNTPPSSPFPSPFPSPYPSPSHRNGFISVVALQQRRPLVPRDDAFVTGSTSITRGTFARNNNNNNMALIPSISAATTETTTSMTLLQSESIYHGAPHVSPSVDV